MASFGYLVLVCLISYAAATIQGECDNSNCPAGHRCVSQTVNCITTPCPPIQRCINPNLEKPGSCPKPRPGMVGICVVLCFGDDSCPGNQKCCGGCPRTCKTPVLREKPGRCPPRPFSFIPSWCRSFESSCSSDTDCLGGQKCCNTGCGHQCFRPLLDDTQEPDEYRTRPPITQAPVQQPYY